MSYACDAAMTRSTWSSLILLVSLFFSGCTKRDDALQTAMEELTRLDSYTRTGLSYQEYQSRFLTVKANIDVALQKSDNTRAKREIQEALRHYQDARDYWNDQIKARDGTPITEILQMHWAYGAKSIRRASECMNASAAKLKEMDALEKREQEQAKQALSRETHQENKTSSATETPKPAPRPSKIYTVQNDQHTAWAQGDAVRRYPDLGVAGSKLNAAYVASYKRYQEQHPEYFSDPLWPLKLAEEVVQASKAK